MQLPFPSHRGLSLSAFILLFLSFLNIAIAAVLPQNGVNTSALNERAPPYVEPIPITEAEYTAYLKKYFAGTENRWVFYTANSEDQAKKFLLTNTDYKYYGDLFESTGKEDHPFDKEFPASANRGDDADAASRAMAKTATDKVHVFGGAEYKTLGSGTVYTTEEVPNLHQGIKDGRIKAPINHMAKDATSVEQVMATEDADGKFSYKPGYSKDTKNASDIRKPSDTDCKRDGGACPATACGPGEARIGGDRECKKCPAGKVPAANGKTCVKDTMADSKDEPKNDPKNNNDPEKEKKSARTKWCLGLVAGSGLIQGAESLRTPEGTKALENAGNEWPSDAQFGNLDYALGDSNMNVDKDKSARVPTRRKRDLSRRQGLISLFRAGASAARMAESITQAARAAAEAAVEATRFIGQSALRVGGKGRAGEADAAKLANLNKASSAERSAKAAEDLTKVKNSKEFRDCLLMAIPEAGMLVADAAMHKSGVPEGGFKPVDAPIALLLFQNEDNGRDVGSNDNHGPSHYWNTYNDAFWHDNRLIPSTCQSAGGVAGKVSAFAVDGGCCAFYADDKCTSPMFMATNRQDMNLKGNANDHITSWSCTKDLGCAGVPNWNNYAGGQCGVHITQYQANPGKNPIAFEVSVLDSRGQEIFHQPRTDTNADLLTFNIPKFQLDMKIDITKETIGREGKGGADDNAKFTVGGDSFWSGSQKTPDPRCKFGKYDGSGGHPGKREGDCGFTCP